MTKLALIQTFLVAGLSLLDSPSATAQSLQWDPQFGTPGGMNGPVEALAVFDDGSGPALFVGGWFSNAEGVAVHNVARRVGGSWQALGAGLLDGPLRALASFDDGSGPALYATGFLSGSGGQIVNGIARWNGAGWSALGSGLSGEGEAIVVFDDGSGPALYVGGAFNGAGGLSVQHLARWNGSSWSAVGGGWNGNVDALTVFDDGSGPALYAGGYFTLAGGVPASGVARWNGSNWSALGAGTDPGVVALAVFDDGSGPKLCAAGTFTIAGGSPANHVAAWDGTSWSAFGAGVDAPVRSLAVFDDGSGPALCAGGSFTSSGAAPVAHVARWTGSSWSALGSGLDAEVDSLISYDDGSGPALWVGGVFSHSGSLGINRLARWNGSAWSSPGNHTGQGCSASFASGAASVRSLAARDESGVPTLYAGGTFGLAGGVPTGSVARRSNGSWSALGPGIYESVNTLGFFDEGAGPVLFAAGDFGWAGGLYTRGIARWNGSSWSAVGGGLAYPGFGQTLAVFDDGSGPRLYLGGSFTFAGATASPNLARWNGTSWSTVGGGLVGAVNALAVFDDGHGAALYAAGTFSSAGSVPANRIARWDGASWSALGSGLSNDAYALVVFDDGSGPALYAGGYFTSAGGVNASGIAKWDGTSWSALGGGVSATGHTPGVTALGVFDDGSGPALHAGGDFDAAGGVPAGGLARWDGAHWSGVGGGTNGLVHALLAFDDGAGAGADLYLGGAFTRAGALDSQCLAEWHGGLGALSAFCFGDGSSGACPCSNSGIAGHGCENSASSGGARLYASGSAQADTLVLHATGELASALSIFLQGDQLLYSGQPFGDGVRCAGGHLRRLFARNASGGGVAVPGSGDPTIRQQAANLGDVIGPGAVRLYQTYYRDPSASFCPAPAGNTWNATNALRVVW